MTLGRPGRYRSPTAAAAALPGARPIPWHGRGSQVSCWHPFDSRSGGMASW